MNCYFGFQNVQNVVLKSLITSSKQNYDVQTIYLLKKYNNLDVLNEDQFNVMNMYKMLTFNTFMVFMWDGSHMSTCVQTI